MLSYRRGKSQLAKPWFTLGRWPEIVSSRLVSNDGDELGLGHLAGRGTIRALGEVRGSGSNTVCTVEIPLIEAWRGNQVGLVKYSIRNCRPPLSVRSRDGSCSPGLDTCWRRDGGWRETRNKTVLAISTCRAMNTQKPLLCKVSTTGIHIGFVRCCEQLFHVMQALGTLPAWTVDCPLRALPQDVGSVRLAGHRISCQLAWSSSWAGAKQGGVAEPADRGASWDEIRAGRCPALHLQPRAPSAESGHCSEDVPMVSYQDRIQESPRGEAGKQSLGAQPPGLRWHT